MSISFNNEKFPPHFPPPPSGGPWGSPLALFLGAATGSFPPHTGRSLFPSQPVKKRHVEAPVRDAACAKPVRKGTPGPGAERSCLGRGGALTFAIAFLYLMAACSMRSCTLIFPSPHGTTTRVLPKHTVTFMSPPLLLR